MKKHLDTEITPALKTRLRKPVVLTGLMGTGKSAAGKLLSEKLDIPFYDSDQEIESRAGLSINEIFELYGEEKFRDTESKVIRELLEKDICVIATGGGALTTPAVLEAVKQKSLSIWLQTPVPVLVKRLEQTKNRPLLKNDNPQAVLEDLLEKRKALYAQMDCHIETNAADLKKTLSNILEALQKHIIDETP